MSILARGWRRMQGGRGAPAAAARPGVFRGGFAPCAHQRPRFLDRGHIENHPGHGVSVPGHGASSMMVPRSSGGRDSTSRPPSRFRLSCAPRSGQCACAVPSAAASPAGAPEPVTGHVALRRVGGRSGANVRVRRARAARQPATGIEHPGGGIICRFPAYRSRGRAGCRAADLPYGGRGRVLARPRLPDRAARRGGLRGEAGISGGMA